MLKRHSVNWQRFGDSVAVIGLSSLLVTLLFCLLTFTDRAAAMTQAAPAEPGGISGRVTADVGVGLAGIEVALFRGQDYYPLLTTKTNADGYYQLLGLGPGVYYARFADPLGHFQTEYYDNSFVKEALTELVIAGNQLADVDATLAVGGQITGTVATHQGLIGLLQLSLYQQQQNTDPQLIQIVQLLPAASSYRFPGLAPGNYYLCASAIVDIADSGYSIENQECYDDVATALPAQAKSIAVQAGQTTGAINFLLDDRPDRGRLTGTVVTTAGMPLSNTLVMLYRNDDNKWAGPLRRTKTDDRGRFAFYYLDPIAYALTFEDPQAQWLYEGTPIESIGDHALSVSLSPPHHRQQITATVVAAAQITGVVTFYGAAPPQSGVVKAYTQYGDDWWETRAATVDAAGAYTLTGLYAGTYRLGVEARLIDGGQQTYYGGATLATATDLLLAQGEMRRNLNWNLEGLFDSVISGTVTADGQPVAGIQVELWHGYPEGAFFIVYTVTDNAGNYRFAGLPQSTYFVRFADPQGRYAVTYHGGTLWMAASPGLYTDGTNQFVNINATLIRGGAIHGTVRRYDGTPVANALAGAYMTTDQVWWSQVQEEILFLTDEKGEYTITGLRPGLYRVGFAAEGQRYPSEEFYGPAETYLTATNVQVEADKTTEGIDITLGPDHLVWLPLLAR